MYAPELLNRVVFSEIIMQMEKATGCIYPKLYLHIYNQLYVVHPFLQQNRFLWYTW